MSLCSCCALYFPGQAAYEQPKISVVAGWGYEETPNKTNFKPTTSYVPLEAEVRVQAHSNCLNPNGQKGKIKVGGVWKVVYRY